MESPSVPIPLCRHAGPLYTTGPCNRLSAAKSLSPASQIAIPGLVPGMAIEWQ
jgi:hypothetical protein